MGRRISMRQNFKISDNLQLLLERNTIRITSVDGNILLVLPKENFIRAAINSYIQTRQNNHYHNIIEKLELAYASPLIESVGETSCGVVMKGTLTSPVDSAPFMLEFKEDDDGFAVMAKVLHPRINRIQLTCVSSEQERFYGFGEQFTYVDFTGKRFPLIVGEQGLGRGAEPCSSIVEARSGSAGDAFTTYAPIAITVTSENRALYVENARILRMDIKSSHPEQVMFEIWSRRLDLRVWQGESLLDAISKHTACTGRYVPLPRWAHGVIVGLRGGTAQVERILQQCETAKVPVSALWIEDWVGRRGANYGPPLWWRWEPNETVYPDFKNWVAWLNAKGIKVLTYFNPFIADDPEFHQYQEAMANGYFVLDESGKPYHKQTGMGFGYYMVDLSNRKAFEWLKQIMIHTIHEYGISGWMADYGEYLSLDCILSNGVGGEEYHQQYAIDWIRLNREVVEEAGLLGEILIFNRCGFGTVNKYAISFWEGDQNVTWDEHDGLASSIVGLLSGGLSGIALNHSDIGGHTTLVNPLFSMVRSKELLWRWIELSTFLPIFRTHVGTLQTPNQQFYSCDESFRFFGLMGRLHDCLTDYFLHLETEAADFGYPLIRHTMLHDDTAAQHDLRYQFMLGSDVVVFPIWKQGAMEVEGYIPQGIWINPWNGQRYEGGRFQTFKASYGKPAVLMRESSSWGEKLLAALQAFQKNEAGIYRELEGKTPVDLAHEGKAI